MSRIRASAGAAVVVFAISLIAFGGTPGALANDGDPLVQGGGININNAQSSTRLQMDTTSPTATSVQEGGLEVYHQADANDIKPIGILGSSGGNTLAFPDVSVGVLGTGSEDGIWGLGSRNGIVGKTANNGASGVYGENQGTGYGVAGRANNGTGVFADTQGGTSLLATAVGGTAVDASVTAAGGTGVKTKAPNSGTALSVTGKAKFSRSGVVTIGAGAASQAVTLSGVTSGSMVLATAQQQGSVAVQGVVPASPSAGHFTIYLTANAPAGGLKVAYFVLN